MRKKICCNIILLLIAIMSASGSAFAQGEGRYEDTEVFAVTSLSSKNLYVGYPVSLSVRLYSTNPSIDFARPVSHPDYTGFDVKRYPIARTDRYHRVIRDTYKGKQYYCVWLEDVVLIPQKTGTFNIKGEDFIAGLNEYEIYSDPFWGTIRRASPVEYPVKTGSLKVKVSNLPGNQPKGFSGAVGEYSVATRVPKGLRKGDNATLIVEVKGQGDLSQVELPDLLNQFPAELGVKSISQDCEVYLEEGVIRSILTFECVFVPTSEGTMTIPAIDFVYLNPDTKKYVTAKSSPVSLEVLDSSTKNSRTVYQDI